MAKYYLDKDVYAAAIERYEIIFNNFDNIYFSFSGGKDSSVMLQLAAQVARRMNRRFDVLFIDLEAQYAATIEHVELLKGELSDVIRDFYWVALPISLRNASSIIQPKWTCWDKADHHKWVRELPDDCINEDNCNFDFYEYAMEFEQFTPAFAAWYENQYGGKVAAGIGIRSDESLNRHATITSQRKEKFNGYGWTTRVKLGTKLSNVYNFYPIYDWRTEDIWTAVSRFNLQFNEIYEMMHKNGLSIHEQRLCQPYGDDQRDGLDQFRYIEPDTWEKVVNRVHGVNFGNIYARTSLLGNIKSEKPKNMTWEQYAVFLLETLGLYAPELREHYYLKIKTFMEWYRKNEGLINIPDVDDEKLESAKKVASWRRIARAIEKNDFWMTRLSFSQTKNDVQRLFDLKKKYANLIYADDTDQKHLKQYAKQIEVESSDFENDK